MVAALQWFPFQAEEDTRDTWIDELTPDEPRAGWLEHLSSLDQRIAHALGAFDSILDHPQAIRCAAMPDLIEAMTALMKAHVEAQALTVAVMETAGAEEAYAELLHAAHGCVLAVAEDIAALAVDAAFHGASHRSRLRVIAESSALYVLSRLSPAMERKEVAARAAQVREAITRLNLTLLSLAQAAVSSSRSI
jgi:hypothetical protein